MSSAFWFCPFSSQQTGATASSLRQSSDSSTHLLLHPAISCEQDPHKLEPNARAKKLAKTWRDGSTVFQSRIAGSHLVELKALARSVNRTTPLLKSEDESHEKVTLIRILHLNKTQTGHSNPHDPFRNSAKVKICGDRATPLLLRTDHQSLFQHLRRVTSPQEAKPRIPLKLVQTRHKQHSN